VIAITNERRVLRYLPDVSGEQVIGLHSRYGFLSESSLEIRSEMRRQRGLPVSDAERQRWVCKFKFEKGRATALSDCELSEIARGGSSSVIPRSEAAFDLVNSMRCQTRIGLGKTSPAGSASGRGSQLQDFPELTANSKDESTDVHPQASGSYRLSTSLGDYYVHYQEAKPAFEGWQWPGPKESYLVSELSSEPRSGRLKVLPLMAILSLLLAMLFSGRFEWRDAEEKKQSLREMAKKQLTIVIPKVKVALAPKVESKKPQAKVKRKVDKGGAAIQNQLGFLSLLGKSELKKVLGGLENQVRKKTAGAGKGGDRGSGGQLLSGLGKGVRQASVGNSGVSGLGGIGDAGAGGGLGGFGKSYIGSGGPSLGRVLSDVSLAEDVELEGGLDRAVIQATIAKYLSQIRACYERGLRKHPALTGQVTMDFEIAASGKLNFAKVKRTSLANPPVESCISQVMLTWQFPKPVGGTLVRVNYPFMLKPSSYM
jgi:hypothetical protein